MKYVHTNSTDKTFLQQYLDDIASIGADLYRLGGFETVEINGKDEIVGRVKGVSKLNKQRTVRFDTPRPKYNTDGFYCANVTACYQAGQWIIDLPDFNDYDGLTEINDISSWVAPIND